MTLPDKINPVNVDIIIDRVFGKRLSNCNPVTQKKEAEKANKNIAGNTNSSLVKADVAKKR